MFILHPKGYNRDKRNVHLLFKLLYHRDCHLSMEVLRSSAFIAVICPGYSRRRRYILLTSSTDISIGIVFANTNTASSDTGLKPLIRLIELRRYTEDDILLVVPTGSASDNIGHAYDMDWTWSSRCLSADVVHVLLEARPIVDNHS